MKEATFPPKYDPAKQGKRNKNSPTYPGVKHLEPIPGSQLMAELEARLQSRMTSPAKPKTKKKKATGTRKKLQPKLIRKRKMQGWEIQLVLWVTALVIIFKLLK